MPPPFSALPARKLRELVTEAGRFTFQFYEWKKADADGSRPVWQGDTLAAHWLAHNKKMCPRCGIALIKAPRMLDRRSFYCENCQVRHT